MKAVRPWLRFTVGTPWGLGSAQNGRQLGSGLGNDGASPWKQSFHDPAHKLKSNLTLELKYIFKIRGLKQEVCGPRCHSLGTALTFPGPLGKLSRSEGAGA